MLHHHHRDIGGAGRIHRAGDVRQGDRYRRIFQSSLPVKYSFCTSMTIRARRMVVLLYWVTMRDIVRFQPLADSGPKAYKRYNRAMLPPIAAQDRRHRL
jgi:hypothetical protein